MMRRQRLRRLRVQLDQRERLVEATKNRSRGNCELVRLEEPPGVERDRRAAEVRRNEQLRIAQPLGDLRRLCCVFRRRVAAPEEPRGKRLATNVAKWLRELDRLVDPRGNERVVR